MLRDAHATERAIASGDERALAGVAARAEERAVEEARLSKSDLASLAEPT